MTVAIRPHLRALLFLFTSHFSLLTSADAAGLSGRVVDPSGKPVANAAVIVNGATAAPLLARTDGDGKFAIASLEPGSYSVVASAPGLASSAQAVRIANDATIEIALRISAFTETLVVSAAQIDQPLSRIPDSVTVIDGREIDARQQFTLASVLRSVPGLTLQQNGGPGTVTSLFTRGGESDYTLVLVDGVRANAFGGGLDLSQVPVQDVERIEVLRGSQSALYGSDAIAGVVQVVTRSAGRPSAQAQVEAGSRQMRRAGAATSGEVNGFRWQLGANYFEDAGFTGTAANGQSVSNDDAHGAQGAASIGWRHPARGSDLQASVQYVDTDRGSPGAYGSDPGPAVRRRRLHLAWHHPKSRRRRADDAAVVRRLQPRPPAGRARRRGLRPQVRQRVRCVRGQHASCARARPDRRVGQRRARFLGRTGVAG